MPCAASLVIRVDIPGGRMVEARRSRQFDLKNFRSAQSRCRRDPFGEVRSLSNKTQRECHRVTLPSRPPLSSHFRHWLLLPPSGSIAIAPQRSSRLGECFKKAHQKDHTLIARKNGGSSSRGICANTILATRSHPTCPRQVSPASAATRLQIRPLQSGARAERR